MPKKKKSLLKKKSLKAKRESSTKELGDWHTRTSSEGGTLKKEVSVHQSSVPSSVESGRDSWASEEIRRKTDGMGLTYPQSLEEKKRKRARKRRIKRIIMTIKEAPPVFKGVDVEEENPKAKKEGANSQPSPAMKKLKRRMWERKLKMSALTAKNPFIRQLLLAFTGPEVRRSPTLVQSTIGSKEEEVARELIGKTAKQQFRKQQGVWASWGKPYKCHGVPNVNPLPEAPYSLDGPNKLASFKFFADPDHVVSSARQGENRPKAAAKRKSASQLKKEKELKVARRSSEMDEMLMKMGLLFTHDLDHAKFPKDHLQVSNDITKLIKYAGVYFQGLREGMIRSIPRSLSVAPLEGDQFILGEGGQALPLYKEPGVELIAPAGKATAISSMGKSSQLSKRSSLEQSPSALSSSVKSCTKSQKKRPTGLKQISSPDNMVVFRWKKTNLTLRLKHEKDLRQKLSARMDRRERIRASSLFSSEVANKMLKVMAEFLSRYGPDTAYIWKIAEAHYEARQPQPDPFWKSAVFSVNRFYSRVATFIMEQPVADPLVDILIYFLKEWLEGGGKLEKAMLINLCSNLARIPEELAYQGRMVNVMPILDFIGKELHVTIHEFNTILRDSTLHQKLHVEYMPVIISTREDIVTLN